MQKKLLLLFIAVNCVMVQATETQVDKDKDAQFREKVKALFEQRNGKREDLIASYKKKLPGVYQQALAKELAGEEEAIKKQSETNKKANKEDEDDKKKHFDDSQPGWFSTSVTENSIKGYMEGEWAGIKQEKDEINAEQLTAHLQKFNNYKKIVNEKVIPTLEREIIYINYEMGNTFYRGLERCGIDKECLLDHNVHLPLTEEFLDRFINAAIDPVIKVVRENEIPLTDDEVRMIARKKIFEVGEEKAKLSLASAEESKRKVMEKLHELLNPKEIDETIFSNDIKNDQNDQGALSQ